jgi:hypothetical protein
MAPKGKATRANPPNTGEEGEASSAPLSFQDLPQDIRRTILFESMNYVLWNEKQRSVAELTAVSILPLELSALVHSPLDDLPRCPTL